MKRLSKISSKTGETRQEKFLFSAVHWFENEKGSSLPLKGDKSQQSNMVEEIRMMKGVLIFILTGMIAHGFLWGNLPGVYKKGIIELNPVREFGMDTDWSNPDFYKFSAIVVSKNGNIFASISNQHKICKFDLKGKLLLKFSQKGQGPGDTFYPSRLSILDDKYLVVSEYAANRRISLFDLNGKFYKLARTDYPVNNAIGLTDNKIAIMSISYFNGMEKISIYIKDINTGAEKCVATSLEKMRKIKTDEVTIRSPFQKRCFINKTGDGNLLVGFNDSNIISIYSHHGKKIDSFELDIKPIPVTDTMVSKIKEGYFRYVHGGKKIRSSMKHAYRSFRILFAENLPLYGFLMTDEEGNILVFYYNGYDKLNKPGFRVYSPKGEYICDCVLDFKNCENVLMDFRFKRRIAITDKGLFGIFGFNDGDDIYYRIMWINLN
jgi:WD40 repeat protein